MYCSSCGAEIREGLRFCNHCGANIAPVGKAAPPRLLTMIFGIMATIAVVTLIGFVMIFFFAVEVMSRGNVSAEVVVFLLVFTLVVFGIIAMLVWQLSRLLSVYLQTDSLPKAETRITGVSKNTGQLTEPKQATSQIPPPQPTQTLTAEEMTRKLETHE